MITLVKKGNTYSAWEINKTYDVTRLVNYKIPVITSKFIKVISTDINRAFESMDAKYGIDNWEYDPKMVLKYGSGTQLVWVDKEYVDNGEDTIVPFGKYKGLSIKEVFTNDLGYFEWLAKSTDDDNFKNTISNSHFWKKHLRDELELHNERAKEVSKNSPEVEGMEKIQLTFERNLKIEVDEDTRVTSACYYHTDGDTIYKLLFNHYKIYQYSGYEYALPKIKGSGKRIKNKEYILGVEAKADSKIGKENVWDDVKNRYVEKLVKRQTLLVRGMKTV